MALQTTQRSPGSSSSPGHLGLDQGKKAIYQNRSWVRGRDPEPVDDSSDDSETGRPSLLSRLESPSLLKRIAPPAETAATSSLAARLTDPPAAIDTGVGEDYDEDVDMHDAALPATTGTQVKTEETVEALPSPTKERRGWKTRGVRPTIDVFGEPTGPAAANEPQDTHEDPIEEDEDSPTSEPIPVSDTVVDALLADILPLAKTPVSTPSRVPPMLSPPQSKENLPPGGGDVDMTHGDSMSTAAVSHPPSSSPLPKSLLEKCRALLMPTIVQYAKRRDPALNEHVAEERILARLSDDRCLEFVQLAKQMQTQLQAQGGGARSRDISISRPASVLKRPLDEEDYEGQPALKIPRTDEPEELNGAGGDVQTARRLRSSTPRPGDEGGIAATPAVRLCLAPIRAVSPRRADTPMSVTPLPSRSASPARYRSIRSFAVSSKEPDVYGSGITQSPVTFEPPFSAGASLPSATISHSTTPPPPLQTSRSPPPAEVPVVTFSSLSLNTPHHETDLITFPSHTTTKDPPVAPDANRDTPQDSMQEKEDAQVQPLVSKEPTLVPALWSAVLGKPAAGIEDVEFFVDDATATATRKWAQRKKSFSFGDRHVQVHLLCLPAASVSEIYQTMPPEASREDVVAAVWNIKTDWPAQGTLVVQADAKDAGGPWVPIEHSGPLDITGAIRRGRNSFKLIQLADMSSKLFVFHASDAYEEQRTTVGSDTIRWMQSLTTLAPHSPRHEDRH